MQKTDSFDIQWLVAGVPTSNVPLIASSTSIPIMLNTFFSFSLNYFWTQVDNPVGQMSLQVCNAHTRNWELIDGQTANWVTLEDFDEGLGINTPPLMLTVYPSAYSWLRLSYVVESGGDTDTFIAQFQGITV